MKSRKYIVFAFLISYFSFQNSFAQDYRLGLFDLSAGIDHRINSLNRFMPNTNQEVNSKPEYANYLGGFVRVQASFFNLFFAKPNAKVEFGDMIVAEISPGYSIQNKHPNLGTGFKGLYNFQFGGVALIHFNQNFDFQTSISIFKFGTDYFNDFWGGSSYEFKFRYSRLFAEIALISENHMYFGFLNTQDLVKDENLNKGCFGLAYFVAPHRRVGFKSELMPIFNVYKYQNFGLERVFSTKIYYAINF